MKHYCPIPFRHIAIRPNGTVQPCCSFKWDEIPKDFTLAYKNLFYEHPFMNKIRADLLEDKPVKGCSVCYKSEELTGRSMRTEYLSATPMPPEQPTLTYIDLALSNVCNNRCRMCSYELSTNWYSDSKKLGIEIPHGLIEHKNNLDDVDFSKLNYIKMIGGEPLMVQDKFIEVLERCNLKDMTILITTNSTVKPNDKLLSLFDKCKRVHWALSIDAYGEMNDFLRKGSYWEEVKSNLDWFFNRFPKTVKVNGVVSIYNANSFIQLADYVKKTYPDMRMAFNIVDGSDWMHPKNLPIDVKQSVIEQIKDYDHDIVPRVIDAIMQDGNFEDFVKMDSKLNSLRTENWQTANPSLYTLLKDKYDSTKSASNLS